MGPPGYDLVLTASPTGRTCGTDLRAPEIFGPADIRSPARHQLATIDASPASPVESAAVGTETGRLP
jgi:hypothetical protein